jgi:glucose-6-phosphate 1-dehydrogenase
MPNTEKSTAVPTIIVLFGATGDLAKTKIAPALFHLYKNNQLPERLKVVGFARRPLQDSDFHAHLSSLGVEYPPDFLTLFSYTQGNFNEAQDYVRLGKTLESIDAEWGMCSNKLFYLAVPPALYSEIFSNLADSGLSKPCGGEAGWTRVIVEKPFGRNAQSAKELDELLARLFKEEQIYRIDHYLAKEMMQNMLAFRFSNNLFEANWGAGFIESIQVKFLEKIGVDSRGGFYDEVGALRDVGQNHVLQMLAIAVMDNPGTMEATAVRSARARVLSALRIPNVVDFAENVVRGQYDGYRQISGTASDSQTETYFRIQTSINLPRWRNVPVILEGGKGMPQSQKEIIITFTHPAPFLHDSPKEYKNKLTFRLEPEEGAQLTFWAKKPGLQMEMEERSFDFLFRNPAEKEGISGYEKLLLDCINGDQSLFVSSDEIAATWRFVDPIIEAWASPTIPLLRYQLGTQPH